MTLEAIRVLVDFLYGSPTWTKHQVSEEAGSSAGMHGTLSDFRSIYVPASA